MVVEFLVVLQFTFDLGIQLFQPAGDDVEALVGRLKSTFGIVDVWINNAGADILTGEAGRMPRLKKLDLVAYLRFASVYQGFESLEDFEAAIGQLRSESEAASKSGPSGKQRPLTAR